MGKILSSDLISFSRIYSFSRSAIFWGMKTTSCPLPLLGSLRCQLSFIHVGRGQFEDFPDPHSPSGHQFQNQSISRFERSENDFIQDLLFQDFPLGDFRNLEEFSHHRVVAGVLQGGFVIVLDEIEEGAEVGIAGQS